LNNQKMQGVVSRPNNEIDLQEEEEEQDIVGLTK
jgi:hypothetical protein